MLREGQLETTHANAYRRMLRKGQLNRHTRYRPATTSHYTFYAQSRWTIGRQAGLRRDTDFMAGKTAVSARKIILAISSHCLRTNTAGHALNSGHKQALRHAYSTGRHRPSVPVRSARIHTHQHANGHSFIKWACNSLNWLIVGIVVLMVVRMGLRNHLYIRAHTVGPCHSSDTMMHVWQTR